ncbi:MAG: hypothetical protein GC152_06745 [Alphaproteobacteria bacterium]|nr:hypothetical protein [Alphaproteobacteria bacterium]
MSEIGSVDRAQSMRLSDRSLFQWLIALATLGSPLFMVAVAPHREASTSLDDLLGFMLVFSSMHVALTAYFFVNEDYRNHLMARNVYYLWLPALVIAGAGASVLFLQYTGKVYLTVFYHAWLLFHYGRQNFGVLSFIGISSKSGKALRSERIALHLAPIGGILGAHALLPEFDRTAFGPYLAQSVLLGKLFTAGALLSAAIAIAHHVRAGASAWRIVMIAMLSAFYLPTFFFDNYLQAVMSYALAHALQYFVFMYFLAAGDPDRSPNRSLFILGACGVIGWAALLATRERTLWQGLSPEMDRFMVGAALGVVMWHFIVDAGVWRLSDAWFRERCFRRFAFLFDR